VTEGEVIRRDGTSEPVLFSDWCGGGDLNPYALRRKHLRLVSVFVFLSFEGTPGDVDSWADAEGRALLLGRFVDKLPGELNMIHGRGVSADAACSALCISAQSEHRSPDRKLRQNIRIACLTVIIHAQLAPRWNCCEGQAVRMVTNHLLPY
jgi:hypothetical protein